MASESFFVGKLVPGFPALNPKSTAASLPGTGAADVKQSADILTINFNPSSSFSYAMPGGGNKAFYYKNPVELPAPLATIMIAQGLGTSS